MSISAHIGDIVEKASLNPAIAVVAATGTGKSTNVPIGLARNAPLIIPRTPDDTKLTSRIFVSVPTVLSARLLAKRVSQLARDKNVGYAAEGDIQYNDDTDIIYATSGHIRKLLLRYFNDGICNYHGLNFTDYLMLDEIHTGSIDNSIAIGLWNICYRSGVNYPHLILSSATPDESVYTSLKVNIETITIDNLTSHGINIRYLDEDFSLDDKSIYKKIAELITSYHNAWAIEEDGMKSTFLVFVPGSAEVHTVIEYLAGLKNANLLPAYSNLSTDELNKITDKPPQGTRNIIISTNLAEASVTIQDVSLVIDSLREKVAGTSDSGGHKLSLDFVPQSSSKQRCGRTGRTRAGVCLRTCTKDFFDNLPQSREHEMKRVPIYSQVMEQLDVGLYPGDVLIGVDKDKIRNSILLLQKLKMLDKDRKVVDKGNFAPRFPLSVRNVSVLWDWLHADYPAFPGVVVVALIDAYGPSYFWYPPKNKKETRGEYQVRMLEHRRTYYTKFTGRSDLHTFINIWSDLMASTHGLADGQKSITKWSNDNSMNNKKIKELIKKVQHINRTLKSLKRHEDFLKNKSLDPGPFTTDGIINAIRPMLRFSYKDSIFVNAENNIRNPTRAVYTLPNSNTRYNLDTKQAVNELVASPPNRLIGLINTQLGNFRLISVALDLPDDPKRPSCPLSNKPRRPITDRVNITKVETKTTEKLRPGKSKSGLDAIRRLRERKSSKRPSPSSTRGLISPKPKESSCQVLSKTEAETTIEKVPSAIKCTNTIKSVEEDNTDNTNISSVKSVSNLCHFSRTFDPSSLSLDVGEQAIWDENFHLRQVFVNRRQLLRLGRNFSIDDRIIQFPESENPSPTMKYEERTCEIKTMDHWGQRKLFITELEFLTLYASDNTVVVYAGSAPGYHITYLAELFPTVQFHLFDSRNIVATGPNIQKLQSLFTDDFARHYGNSILSGSNILFISDIRTGQEDIKKTNKPGFKLSAEEAVKTDMEMQERWVRIMNPTVSMLKFRLPWTSGKTNYLNGEIRPQPWVGATSSETRLIVTDSNSTREYDNDWYSNVMHYFNTRTRETFYENGLNEPYDHCYDCNSEILISMQYLLRIEPDLAQNPDELLQRIQTMGDTISNRVGPEERKTLKIV